MHSVIDSVSRKGKQIFFKLIDKEGVAKYLNSRLGLQGKWCALKENNTRFWMELQRTTVIDLNNVSIETLMLYNDDSQNFGGLELFSEIQYQNKLNKLGPDL